ncbi:protein kinase domain-containing protein [Rhodococcus sp. MSC1_016]|jgi:serine/threonine-protein kinase PknK|uniref:serine/threonine-protein kinase n=1 Tax=Rhodococcus sp. MSC1_016 TaxID=2909266 RepID=UPI00202FB984|nr:serine/threonine-protein kinase [Rhodococcus sp. MSC1_016]
MSLHPGDPEPTQAQAGPTLEDEFAEAGFEDAREIGRGGFGVVYRCRQTALHRTVAIKVLFTEDTDQDHRARFLREQQAMGSLSGHPNIVDVLQTGVTSRGRPYIVMPYHSGASLDTRIREQGPLSVREVLSIGVKLAGALHLAHRAGIVHRDVKPANILVTAYGEPQLTDFGIARVTGGFETTTGTVAGSPSFTAPDVLKGETPTVTSDVYSLAVTLYCLLTGHSPFERRPGERIVAQFLRITGEAIPDLRPTGVPDTVCTILEQAMSRDPTERPSTVAEFAQRMRDVQRRLGVPVDEMALPEDLSGPREPMHTNAPVTLPRPRTPTAVAPPSASTKFRPPTPTRALVPRARLLDLLRAGQRRRLVLIHAPAGFGKSTLAAQWREHLITAGIPVAWLSIDHDDNNTVWFLAHLTEAIRTVRPALAHELGQALEEHGDDAERYVLTSLINEIHQTGELVVVIIDDWHRITDHATIEAIDFLLTNSCHHLQVVVTSRSRTGLPLSRLRVLDELVEIDGTDLRFDDDEARSFLVDLGGLTLAADDVIRLRASTDGWVAALQLASLSLRGRDNPTELIGHLSGRHRAIGDYLVENVLNTLEPDILDFLLRSSVTERLCGPLAARLAEVPRGQAMLEQVEGRDLFLRRLDDDGEWFRYHHLFADFLRRRLERDHPDLVRHLHFVASQWFAEHAMLSEAVDHALAAGDPETAADLVETHGMLLIEHSQMATLLGLTAKLVPEQVHTRPRLQIAVAWAHVLLHHPPHPIQDALRGAESALERIPTADAPADAADLLAELSLVRGVSELFADHVADLDKRIAECLTRPDTLRPFVVSAAANVAAYQAIYTFDFAAARRWQEWARPYHERTTGPFSVMYGACFTGIAAMEQLDTSAAHDAFRTAQQLARQIGGRSSHALRLAGAILADLLYEQGHIGDAEKLLDESHELGSEGGVVDFMLATYGTGARIKLLRGDHPAAEQRLREGAEIAANLSLPRLAARIENERIRAGLITERHIGGHRPPTGVASDGIAAVTAELDTDSTIRLLLADPGGREEATQAITLSTELLDRARQSVRPRAELRTRLLLVCALHAAGRTDDAVSELVPAIVTCSEHGLIRPLLDAGPGINEVLADLESTVDAHPWPPGWSDVAAIYLTNLPRGR